MGLDCNEYRRIVKESEDSIKYFKGRKEVLYKGEELDNNDNLWRDMRKCKRVRAIVLGKEDNLYRCLFIEEYDFHNAYRPDTLKEKVSKELHIGCHCGYRYKEVYLNEHHLRWYFFDAEFFEYDDSFDDTDLTDKINEYKAKYPELYFTLFDSYNNKAYDRTNDLNDVLFHIKQTYKTRKAFPYGYVACDLDGDNNYRCLIPVEYLIKPQEDKSILVPKNFIVLKKCMDRKNWGPVDRDKMMKEGADITKNYITLHDADNMPVNYCGEYEEFLHRLKNGEYKDARYGEAVGIFMMAVVAPLMLITSIVLAVIIAIVGLCIMIFDKKCVIPGRSMAALMGKVDFDYMDIEEQNRFINFVEHLSKEEKKVLFDSVN